MHFEYLTDQKYLDRFVYSMLYHNTLLKYYGNLTLPLCLPQQSDYAYSIRTLYIHLHSFN